MAKMIPINLIRAQTNHRLDAKRDSATKRLISLAI
jgi:hypothetical protein